MRYPGSKRSLAPDLLKLINSYNIDPKRNIYVEPFLGGANSFAYIAPHFKRSLATEANLDVALMWQAVRAGWQPPTTVTEVEYQALKAASDTPSPLRGFVGSGGSFGGKWFGGYARGGNNADGTPRNHQAESARACLAKASALKNALISHADYSQIPVTKNCVVYCDPPYADTLSYSGATNTNQTFNSAKFWRIAERWHNLGALVLVSEYKAPPNWVSIFETTTRQSVSMAQDRQPTIEKVFMLSNTSP